MHQWGSQDPSRKLLWVEGLTFAGWGCSECDWVFKSAGWPDGRSFAEMKEKFQAQLSKQFDAHVCSQHARTKNAKLPPQHPNQVPLHASPARRKGRA